MSVLGSFFVMVPTRKRPVTYILNQLDRILIDSKIHNRPVTTDVEDGIELGRVDRGEFRGVLHELLGFRVREELGSELIRLESFNRCLQW